MRNKAAQVGWFIDGCVSWPIMYVGMQSFQILIKKKRDAMEHDHHGQVCQAGPAICARPRLDTEGARRCVGLSNVRLCKPSKGSSAQIRSDPRVHNQWDGREGGALHQPGEPWMRCSAWHHPGRCSMIDWPHTRVPARRGFSSCLQPLASPNCSSAHGLASEMNTWSRCVVSASP